MKYIIKEDSNLTRLDKYLMNNTDISRSKIQEMIKENLILVNNKHCKNSYQLRVGDVIEIVGELNKETSAKAENINLDIIYEDDYLMVINKPSGMVVHPANGHYTNTLVNALLYHTKNLSKTNGDVRPGIVHRIDKDTSGLLVVAKNDDVHEALSKQLKDKTLSRVYIALVSGRINHDTGTIDAPIGRDKNDRKKMAVTDENGKESITHFKVLERYKDATLVECRLETGRTHQIRVHMAYIKHPIIGDPVYGYKKTVTEFGQMLHAKRIEFYHPVLKKQMSFECDLPDEFIKELNKYR